MRPLNLKHHLGVSRIALLAGLALTAAAAGGGWWWSQRNATPGNSTQATDSTQVQGPGASAGALSGAASAPGASGAGAGGAGAAGSAANRRFGGAGPNRVQPVTVAAVRRQDVRVILTGIGNIAAMNTAMVRPRVDGELRAIKFKEGQLVRAGAVLAELDPRTFEIALAQSQAQLAKDQSLLKNAQLDLQRYKDLLAKDSIASQQVDTQAAIAQQLQATVQSDQAQVDNAKLQLSFTKITAPISGRLGLKQADLGNIVRASDPNGLVSITQTQPISVVFAMPEANLPQINRRLKGTEPLVVEAWDRELRNQLATGKVSTTDNSIDAATGTIKLKAEFANADGSLFPNQFVNIKLQVNTLESVLTIPTTAIQRGALGTFVYVVKPDNVVTIRRVRLGTTEGDNVSISGELEPAERVVTDGADRLREGAKVEVITPPPRFGAGAGAGGPGAPGAGFGPRGGAGAAGAAAQADAPMPSARPPAAVPPAPPSSAVRPAGPAQAPAQAPAQGTAPAAAAGNSAWIDQLPPEAQDRVRATMQRLGPEVAAKVGKMSPEERRAFFQQLRAQRQQQE